MKKIKYALLDTDYISKTHLIKGSNDNKLIDRIMEMSGYQFFCHEQIKDELERHDIGKTAEWLKKAIISDAVHCITDEDLINELHAVYNDSAEAVYANMLKNGCEAYKKGLFEETFTRVKSVNYLHTTKESFLKILKKDCDDIGTGNNLGELKSYVLFQMLSIKYGEKIYVFCSDDRNARNGIVSLGGARCISVLSSFMRLSKECGFTGTDAEPYIKSYINELNKTNQFTFKIHEATKEMRMCRVPCEQVLKDIYNGRLEELQNGDLRYKI